MEGEENIPKTIFKMRWTTRKISTGYSDVGTEVSLMNELKFDRDSIRINSIREPNITQCLTMDVPKALNESSSDFPCQ